MSRRIVADATALRPEASVARFVVSLERHSEH